MTMNYSPWLKTPAKKRARSSNPEQAIQIAFFKALKILGGPRVFAWSTPNEGKRSRINGDRMRAAGLVAGAPDVNVTWFDGASSQARIMFLEFKAPSGRLTERQKDFHERLRRQGHLVAVVRSVDDALTELRAAGAPLEKEKT